MNFYLPCGLVALWGLGESDASEISSSDQSGSAVGFSSDPDWTSRTDGDGLPRELVI